jgi:hypothetical protein
MNEIDKLFEELKNMQETGKIIPNNSITWSYISQGNWEDAGFDSEEEMKSWIADNPYANL